MNKIFYLILFTTILIFPSMTYGDGPYLNIPPTNAFDKIHSDNGTVTAANFSMPLNIKGGTNISVQSNNATHTVTITNTMISNSATGTYNRTYANNALINSGGFKINFINGSGAIVNVKNSDTGQKVNVTISATGTAGVSLLNAFSGKVNITGTFGNVTVTNSSGTIKLNTGYNIPLLSGTQTWTGANSWTGTKNNFTQGLTIGNNKKFILDGSGCDYILSSVHNYFFFLSCSQELRITTTDVEFNNPLSLFQTGQTTNRATNVPEIADGIGGVGEMDLIGSNGFKDQVYFYTKGGTFSGGVFKSYLKGIIGNQTSFTAFNATSDAGALPPNHMCTEYFVTGNNTFRNICNFNGAVHVVGKG